MCQKSYKINIWLYSYLAEKNKQAIGIPPALINQNLNLDNPDLKNLHMFQQGVRVLRVSC